MTKGKRVKKRPPSPSRCRDCGRTTVIPRWRYFKAGAPKCPVCGGLLDYLGGWQGIAPRKEGIRPQKVVRRNSRPAEAPPVKAAGLTRAEKTALKRATYGEQTQCSACVHNMAPFGETICRPCKKAATTPGE